MTLDELFAAAQSADQQDIQLFGNSVPARTRQVCEYRICEDETFILKFLSILKTKGVTSLDMVLTVQREAYGTQINKIPSVRIPSNDGRDIRFLMSPINNSKKSEGDTFTLRQMIEQGRLQYTTRSPKFNMWRELAKRSTLSEFYFSEEILSNEPKNGVYDPYNQISKHLAL